MPWSNDIPVAVNKSSAQILVSSTIPQQKKPELFREMADSTSGVGNMQDWPQTFIIPESKEVLNKIKQTKKWWACVKGTQNIAERASNDQSWDNLREIINKTTLDYNPTYKINTHEFVLT